MKSGRAMENLRECWKEVRIPKRKSVFQCHRWFDSLSCRQKRGQFTEDNAQGESRNVEPRGTAKSLPQGRREFLHVNWMGRNGIHRARDARGGYGPLEKSGQVFQMNPRDPLRARGNRPSEKEAKGEEHAR